MFFTDPTSARIQHNADLIEAHQARTPHKPSPTDPQRPSARRRFLSFVSELSRRRVATTGPLSASHELFVGHDPNQLMRLGRFFTIVDVPAGEPLGLQGHTAREFVTILRGEVGVTIDGVPHAVLDDGSHFGAVPLLADEKGAVHSASFTAMSPTCIAVATTAEFRALLCGFPLVAQRVQAMTVVRRAYLTGLEQVNALEPSVPFDLMIDEYPVHAVQQPQRARGRSVVQR